jgi:hypothetical protein
MIRRFLIRVLGRLQRMLSPPALIAPEPEVEAPPEPEPEPEPVAEPEPEPQPEPEPEPEPPPPPPPPIDFDHEVGSRARLVNDRGQPNINDLWRVIKDMDALRMSVKALGYELSRTLESQLQSIPVEPPRLMALESKPCTQADIEARWCRGWCATLRERPRYHRRVWESAYVLQALYEAEALFPEAKVLAFGPVDGSVISHLARNNVRSTVVATSAPPRREDLIDPHTFDHKVVHRSLDEQGLDGLEGFDACWSIGNIGGHGSIRAGMDFLVESMKALKPGGLAVHVFDFNFANDEETLDNWPSVLLQRRHIEALAEELAAAGYRPRKLDFHMGHQPLDRFVDMPPFNLDRTKSFESLWQDGWQGAHLKVSVDGFPVTSFGLVCTRPDPSKALPKAP